MVEEAIVAISGLYPQAKGSIMTLSMAKIEPITNYRLTAHAQEEMTRRYISRDEVADVLAAPEQVESVRQGRSVYQSRIEAGEPPRKCLLRVFVDVDLEPPEVVTVYRTSKIAKYWRASK